MTNVPLFLNKSPILICVKLLFELKWEENFERMKKLKVLWRYGSTLAVTSLVRASIALIEPLLLTGDVTVVSAFHAAPTKAEDILSTESLSWDHCLLSLPAYCAFYICE